MTLRGIDAKHVPNLSSSATTNVAKSASALRAAAALRRTRLVVAKRARKLGCPFVTLTEARKKWAGSPNNPWREHENYRFKQGGAGCLEQSRTSNPSRTQRKELPRKGPPRRT